MILFWRRATIAESLGSKLLYTYIQYLSWNLNANKANTSRLSVLEPNTYCDERDQLTNWLTIEDML